MINSVNDAFDQRLVSEAQHHHQSSDVDPFHAVQNGGDQHAASNIIHDPQQLNSKQRTHTESKLLLDLQKTAADKGFDICDNPAQSNPIQSGNGVLDILSQQLRRVKGIKISLEEIRQELVTFLENFPNWLHRTELFNFLNEYPLGSDYLGSMAKDGTLGDEEILYAATNCYKTSIRVISSLGHDVMISPNDSGVVNTNPLVVGLIHKKHYVSLRHKRGMGEYRKNVYLLTKKEATTLTLPEIKGLRKTQQYQRGVTFFENMKDDDVRILLENQFSPILSNKRFSCATREGQANNQYNFDNERRVWDGRTIKRKVKGGSALYLILEDEVSLTQAPQSATTVTSMNTTNSTENTVETTTQREQDMNTNILGLHLASNPVSPARGTPSSLQGHLLSTSFCHNSKNSQTVSLTQTPQSATTVTSMNTTNSTENAEETTPWEQDMCINDVRRLDDILSSLNFSDIGSENPLSPTGFGAIETLSEASFLASRSQEQNQLQNQIPSTSTDTFQSSDSAFSSSKDICFENLFSAIDFGAVETIPGASFLTNRSQEQNQLQNQILSTSTNTFQSGDSAFSSSEETVSQNGIFSAQGTTQEGRMTKPIWLMENNCLPSDKSDFSGQSDSGISSEARVCLSQAPNPPVSLRIQEARIKPTDGPLEGGGLFSAEIDEELPRSMETGWAIFGNKSVKVRIARDGLALFGDKIPRGDAPGPVTVTFTTLDGERVAEATYTYKRRKKPTTWQIKRALDGVEESVKRLRSVADSSYESYKFAAENYHESGSGDAPEPVTVTFTTLDGECEAKATYTYKKRENPTTWQITLVKRSLDDIEEYVKRLRRVAYTCCESDEFAAENYHESGGDAPEPVIVTFTTLDGECEAKATYSYKERENPTTWQITRVKRALDGVEESVKRFRSVADSCYDSDEFVAENYHESVVTQVVKAQLIEEGYFGDAEKSDIEDEDYDLMDNNENEIDEGESFVSLDPRHPSTETDVYERRRHEDIGKIWMDLVGESDFNKSVIDSIKSHNLSEKERCIDLSVQWMEKEGMDGTTASKLANVLTETGLLAETLLGPLNGRRKKVIEITGAIRPSDNNEVMLGIDCYEKTIFFIWKGEGKDIKTSPEELKKYVHPSSHIAAETVEITGEMGSSAEKVNNSFSEKEQRISSQVEDLQRKQMDMAKTLWVGYVACKAVTRWIKVLSWTTPELRVDTFAWTYKMDFIVNHIRTLQELGTKVTFSPLNSRVHELKELELLPFQRQTQIPSQLNSRVHELKELELLPFQRQTQIPSQELMNFVDASSCILAETVEITGEMGSSTEKANNGFSEEEQRIFSQLEDLQRKKLFIMKCLEMPELEETALVSPWDLTELSLIPRTKLIILPGEAANVKSFIETSFDFVRRRLWQNYTSRLLWESEEDGLTEEKKRNLKTLVLFRNNRKNKVMLLKKPWIPLCSPELKNYVDASSHIAAETFENTGEMGSSTEKANNGFSEEEQRIFSQLEDLQRKKLFIMKCLEMPELEETALVSPWDLTELSLIPRTNLIILPGEADFFMNNNTLEPNVVMNESIIHEHQLPKLIGPEKWRDLARMLHFSQNGIDIISEKNNCPKECCIAVIVKWIHRRGQDATVGMLADALTKIELKNVADILLGPINGKKTISIEVRGTIEVDNTNQIILGNDSTGRSTFFVWETKTKEFHTSLKEIIDYIGAIDQFVGNTQKQTKQVVVEDLTCKVNQISENIVKLQKTLSDIKSSLEMPELKGETFSMQRKLELIAIQSGTLEEVYTKVTRMAGQACACDEFAKRQFYNFTFYSLKAVHNDLNAVVADLKSADTQFTKEENEKLQILLADQKRREKQVEQLEATRTQLFSSAEKELKISRYSTPRRRKPAPPIPMQAQIIIDAIVELLKYQ